MLDFLREKLNSVHIDYDWIRDFHLNKGWNNANKIEEKMSFENLLFILRNYIKYKYQNVIIGGFTEKDIKKLLNELKNYKYIVITLFLTNEEVLKQRVLTESRDSGFKDYEEAIKFNKRLREKLKYPNEHKIDNTSQSPEETATQIKDLLSK